MRAEDIKALVSRQPFQPVRIILTDGRAYDIRHPDGLIVGRSFLAIGHSSSNKAVYDHIINVSILHVMQIEPLELSKQESV